jgi:hypothetical protein
LDLSILFFLSLGATHRSPPIQGALTALKGRESVPSWSYPTIQRSLIEERWLWPIHNHLSAINSSRGPLQVKTQKTRFLISRPSVPAFPLLEPLFLSGAAQGEQKKKAQQVQEREREERRTLFSPLVLGREADNARGESLSLAGERQVFILPSERASRRAPPRRKAMESRLAAMENNLADHLAWLDSFRDAGPGRATPEGNLHPYWTHRHATQAVPAGGQPPDARAPPAGVAAPPFPTSPLHLRAPTSPVRRAHGEPPLAGVGLQNSDAARGPPQAASARLHATMIDSPAVNRDSSQSPVRVRTRRVQPFLPVDDGGASETVVPRADVPVSSSARVHAASAAIDLTSSPVKPIRPKTEPGDHMWPGEYMPALEVVPVLDSLKDEFDVGGEDTIDDIDTGNDTTNDCYDLIDRHEFPSAGTVSLSLRSPHPPTHAPPCSTDTFSPEGDAEAGVTSSTFIAGGSSSGKRKAPSPETVDSDYSDDLFSPHKRTKSPQESPQSMDLADDPIMSQTQSAVSRPGVAASNHQPAPPMKSVGPAQHEQIDGLKRKKKTLQRQWAEKVEEAKDNKRSIIKLETKKLEGVNCDALIQSQRELGEIIEREEQELRRKLDSVRTKLRSLNNQPTVPDQVDDIECTQAPEIPDRPSVSFHRPVLTGTEDQPVELAFSQASSPSPLSRTPDANHGFPWPDRPRSVRTGSFSPKSKWGQEQFPWSARILKLVFSCFLSWPLLTPVREGFCEMSLAIKVFETRNMLRYVLVRFATFPPILNAPI